MNGRVGINIKSLLAHDLAIPTQPVPDLVDDAAGEEGGRFLAVSVEVERHQGVGPHREVVVHGQNLGGERESLGVLSAPE